MKNRAQFRFQLNGEIDEIEHPHRYIPEALIRCTRFKDKEGRDIIRTEEITGSIEQQSEMSMKLLETWLETDYELHGTKLKGQLPIMRSHSQCFITQKI